MNKKFSRVKIRAGESFADECKFFHFDPLEFHGLECEKIFIKWRKFSNNFFHNFFSVALNVKTFSSPPAPLAQRKSSLTKSTCMKLHNNLHHACSRKNFSIYSFTLDRIDTHERTLDKVGIKAREKLIWKAWHVVWD